MKKRLLTYDSIGEYITSEIPEFSDIYEQHLIDNGQILPHVLMGDFTRFVVNSYKKSKSSLKYKEIFDRSLDLIENLITSKNKQLQELVQASFLENLHQVEREDYIGIKDCLRDYSLRQLEAIEKG